MMSKSTCGQCGQPCAWRDLRRLGARGPSLCPRCVALATPDARRRPRPQPGIEGAEAKAERVRRAERARVTR